MSSVMRSVKFSIDTLGCKVNQSESDFIAEELQKRGMALVFRSRHPDFCLVNTCTVTSQSDRKARQLIRRIKSENKDSRILVMGCFVVFNRKFLKECGIDLIIGNKDKAKIPDLITGMAAGEAARAGKSREDGKSRESMGNLACRSSLQYGSYGGAHSRPLVMVQDGCEQNCTYCIVPEVRGRYKSVPFKDILERITGLQNDGFEEIVLTGIHIGKYGVDFNTGSSNTGNSHAASSSASSLHGKIKTGSSHRKITVSNLAELLERITKETGIKRIRISSIEINEIGDRLLDVIKKNEIRFAHHLHIPLQSGSDRILKLMGRPYNTGYYLKKVNRIREVFPGISLTTDVIVGFPGEEDDDFAQTVDMVRKIAFSKIHVFKFSKRKHTPAYMMAGQVDEEVKSSRSIILRNLGDELRNSYLKSNIGKTLNVVCEEISSGNGFEGTKSEDSDTADAKSKDSDIAGGTSGNYIKVYFKVDKSRFAGLKGKIVQVTADSIYKNGLFGTLN